MALAARLAMLVGIARQSTSPGQDGSIGTAQLSFPTGEVHDEAPIAQTFGFASASPLGTDHITLHVQGDRTSSISIATNHQGYRTKGLKEGDSAQYDIRGQTITLGPGGLVIDGNGKGLKLTIRNAPNVTIEQNVHVEGNLTVSSGATGSFTTPLGQTVTVQDGIITNIY
jgi:phage gp45-like